MLTKVFRQLVESIYPAARRLSLGERMRFVNQRQAAIAVVIPTVGRESLLRAVRSVFAQDVDQPVQILVGVDIDKYGHAASLRKQLMRECPTNMELLWFEPGYSTSQRYGGVHRCFFGGALRTILSFLANAPIIAYLDDDDWYASDHLRCLLLAIDGKSWAYSLCYYADSQNSQALAVDEIESVGVGAGIYAEKFGGFVRPSALAIDKTRLDRVLHLWSEALGPRGDAEDRLIFGQLKDEVHGCTGVPTVYYSLDPNDIQHDLRMSFIASKRGKAEYILRSDSNRQ